VIRKTETLRQKSFGAPNQAPGIDGFERARYAPVVRRIEASLDIANTFSAQRNRE